MAQLENVLRNGRIFGNSSLRRSMSVIEPANITALKGLELRFYSPTNELVGSVGSFYEDSNLIGLTINQAKIGEVESFTFEIPRNIEIPFYNLMEVRFYKNSNHWFTGELEFKPTQDQRKELQRYSGKGYIHYLKKIKIDKLYENKTLAYAIRDIIENDIQPKTPIKFDIDLINVPDYTITKMQFKKKKADKALNDLLRLANLDYNNQQYRHGVNKDNTYFFEPVPNEVVDGFIEGFQYQNPGTDQDIDSIINQVDIYRAIEDSQEVEFVSRIEDTESQGLWGIRNKDLTISDYVDTDTAERMAGAILSYAKDLFLEITIKDLVTEDLPYDIGFYKIINRKIEYTKILSEFDDLSKWTQSLSSTTIVESPEKVFSGKKAFKCNTTTGSNGDYIEIELDEVLYFPERVIFYLAQEPFGEAINLAIYDDNGNAIRFTEYSVELEDASGFIALENGEGTMLTEQAAINIELRTDYQRISFDVSSLNNIAKVRIEFETDSDFLIYLDRLELLTNTYFQNILSVDKVKYKYEKNALLADMVMGEQQKNLITDLKKLDEKQENTINIFQKL